MRFYSSFDITAENCLNNRAISYGDGVFETMLLNNYSIKLWKLHWQRLSTSLKLLNIQKPNESMIYKKVMQLVNDKGQYTAKLVIFRNDKKRGYASDSTSHQFYITLNPYIAPDPIRTLTRSSVALSKQKNLAGIKHLNRLEQVLAAQELNQTNYKDAIMCNESGKVIETISQNIILFKNNKIFSPKLNKSGVYGVALRWLQLKGHKINWKKIEFNQLAQYHGMMVCNSIQGFSSINSINNTIHFDKKLKIIQLIQKQWNENL